VCITYTSTKLTLKKKKGLVEWHMPGIPANLKVQIGKLWFKDSPGKS
jgi:hypothetical protein